MLYIVAVQSPPVTGTHTVLMKCRYSLRSMIRYDAAAGQDVLVECHRSFSAAFNDSGLLLWKWNCEFLSGGQNKHILHTSRCLVLILVWIIRWHSTQPINTYTHQKVQEIRSLFLAFFFCPILAYFLRMIFSSSRPFLTHIGGHIARTPLPFPLPCLPSF